MQDPQLSARGLDGSGRRFGIVAARFHEALCERLLDGATACLREHGVAEDDLSVARVPGAWEIPQALELLASEGQADGLIALGVVIRGETPHFDYICDQANRGSAAVSARHGLPVTFGVLTCETVEQAAARAGGAVGNKGTEAALAALEMAALFARVRG